LNEKILTENNFFTFGPYQEKETPEEDIIIIIKENQKIYFQRYYG